MPWGLKRYQQARHLHFITFSCYRREALLTSSRAKHVFERALEQMRRQYRFFVTGYVLMPEHVHLLVSEPERSTLAAALQALKQSVSRQLIAGRHVAPEGAPALIGCIRTPSFRSGLQRQHLIAPSH
jgi:REP-associated tyrosine transposase